MVSTDSGNGFLLDGAKPLSETMWAYHQIDNVGLSSNWSIRSCGIYISGLSWKIWRYQSVKWDWNLICWDNFIPSPDIIHLFSSDNSFVCVMVVSWQLLSQSLIPLASVYSRGTRYPPQSLLWPHHRGPMSQELKRQTCCMRSQPHERLWPPLLKLNLEMVGKLISASVAVAKSSTPVFNSDSNSNSRDFNSNSIFNSTNFNSNS